MRARILLLALSLLPILSLPANAAECGKGKAFGAKKPPPLAEFVSNKLEVERRIGTSHLKHLTADLEQRWEAWDEDFRNHQKVCEAQTAEQEAVSLNPVSEVPSSPVGGTLAAIRACESGGDYTAVSPSGTYRGAYQFDYQTWASVGGSGDPAAASPAEQDMRAQMLMDQRGTQPWPVCGG